MSLGRSNESKDVWLKIIQQMKNTVRLGNKKEMISKLQVWENKILPKYNCNKLNSIKVQYGKMHYKAK